MKRVAQVAVAVLLGTCAWAQESSPTPAPTVQGYSFNPLLVKRDPFVLPQLSAAKAGSELMRYDLNELTLVAIMTGMGSPQAMIVIPGNKTAIVRVGDEIGRRNGKVYKITASEVIVQETFRDFQGRLQTSTTNMVLAP